MARDPLDIIEQRESGGKNVPNYKYGPGFTASGHYQMINATWRRWAKDAGIDISQYPRAIDAPKEVQRAVAAHGFQKEGFKPWEATKHLVGQEAKYSRDPTAVVPPRRPDGAPGPRDAPSAPATPQQGMLSSIYEPFEKLAAERKEQQAEQQLAAAQALAADRPPVAPPPPPAAPAAPPVDFAALMFPRIRRGLLGGDSYGLLG